MADEKEMINLRILSPSTEVEGGVTFPDLPASTTIKELRSRIQDAVPSKPATDRMRLIYRGRVVANDADTLANVFGADSIRESKDQSLHLVLRELPSNGTASSNPAPRSSTAPPNPFRPAQAPIPASPPLQTNPFRTIPQPRPNSQPQTPLPHHHHHPHHHPHVHHHHHLQGPPNTFPIPNLEQHLRQTLAQHAQAANTQASTPQGQSTGGTNPTPVNGAQGPQPGPGQVPLMGFGQPNFAPTGARTVRQEGIGPNGERWSVTINETNVNIPNLPVRPQQPGLQRPFPLPPSFGLPPRPTESAAPTDVIDRLLPRIRVILQSARQEMENVRTLFQLPGGQLPGSAAQIASVNPPSWRVERIREHVRVMSQNLDLVERGLAVILADATLAQNADVVVLRRSANELRAHAEEVNRMLAREQGETAGSHTPSTSGPSPSPAPVVNSSTPSTSTSSLPQTQITTQTMPAETPAELFILSSPQGPVGILFDQRGTYTTAPMVSTLPFQTFTDQFVRNRQLIAGIGQHIAQGGNQLHNQLANTQPTQTQQPATNVQAPNQPLDQAQDQAQNQIQNQNQNPAQNANPPAEQDRMVNIAGHLWLIFKLACFVYFFAGGGGLYRPIMLGSIAAVVYLAQIGIFEEQFNLVRRHFEALLPVGALADRAAQPANPNNNNNQAPGQQRNGSMGNLTPEQAARRLLEQRRDQRFGWVRESMRTVERSFALFVASLWPGIGERMVHAQEERLRAERAAEEERQRQEEEKARVEAEARAQAEEKKDEAKTEGSSGETAEAGPSVKGKEKAASAAPETEASSSGQASS
ncbi:Nn.00g007200.m01.CDS01 [Neocucurbitaria sp. VM-36]